MRDPIEFNAELNRYSYDLSAQVGADVHALSSIIESLAVFWRNEKTSRYIEDNLADLQDSYISLMVLVNNATESLNHANA